MSPPPVRVEMKARRRPSGEYPGRDSFAGFETRSRATPPDEGTVQMSPPEANAISEWSGEIPGSANVGTEAGCDVGVELCALATVTTSVSGMKAYPSR